MLSATRYRQMGHFKDIHINNTVLVTEPATPILSFNDVLVLEGRMVFPQPVKYYMHCSGYALYTGRLPNELRLER
jgi:hypothetical protein